jgi:hypothetical protein
MFQQQRRGLDELSRAMLIAALVLSLLGMAFAQVGGWLRYVFTGLGAVLLILMVVRMTSRDTARRYQENMKFLTLTTQCKEWFRHTFRTQSGGAKTAAHRAKRANKNPSWSELRQYKYFICPQCAKRLRVPRGKGRIRVTCTNCGNVFETRS